MGAWNIGNFSNDTALDYLASIATMDDIKRPINAVTSGSVDYIDADLASEALAAADLMASMLGRPAEDLPPETGDLISTFDKPSTDLLTTARAVATRVLEASELAELWDEEDSKAWQDVVNDLLHRLDPEIDYKPLKRTASAKGGFICSVCEAIVPDNELVRAEIGFLNIPGLTMGRYFHSSCIEANFKPPYFDQRGEVLSSLKRQIKRFLKNKSNH